MRCWRAGCSVVHVMRLCSACAENPFAARSRWFRKRTTTRRFAWRSWDARHWHSLWFVDPNQSPLMRKCELCGEKRRTRLVRKTTIRIDYTEILFSRSRARARTTPHSAHRPHARGAALAGRDAGRDATARRGAVCGHAPPPMRVRSRRVARAVAAAHTHTHILSSQTREATSCASLTSTSHVCGAARACAVSADCTPTRRAQATAGTRDVPPDRR